MRALVQLKREGKALLLPLHVLPMYIHSHVMLSAILNRLSVLLLYCDSTLLQLIFVLLAVEILAIPRLDSRFYAVKVGTCQETLQHRQN